MKNRFFYFVILLLAVCLSANANDFKKKRKKQETTPALADALKKEKTEDKSYDKVITKEARTKKGLITLHMVKSTFYMEIPVKLMGKPMLFAGRVAEISDNKDVVAGQMPQDPMLVEWSCDEEKVYLHNVISRSVCDENEPIAISMERNNLKPVIRAFPIKAFSKDSSAQVIDYEYVMVIGCGMIGIGAIVRAALRGATVIAVDLDDEKLELAKKVGASYVINSKTENVHERMQQITEGFGADVVIEAVGSPVTYVMAVDEVGFTGRVVCIGYAKSEVAFQTKYFVQKELDIRGSRNALPADFRAVINYMKEGNCPVEELISKIAKPEGALEAMQEWTANPGKVFRILVEF